MVTCGSDPKSDRASPVELPSLPLLSPSPLSGSRGQKMRARGKGRSFYILGGSLPPPCRAAGPLPPHHLAAGGLLPGTGAVGTSMQININFICAKVFGGVLPPRCRAAGPLPPGTGAAGSRQGYKSSAPSLAPSFSEIQRGERERGGVRKVIPPAKPYRILDLKKNLVYFLRS